jgi:hypothetical protein
MIKVPFFARPEQPASKAVANANLCATPLNLRFV